MAVFFSDTFLNTTGANINLDAHTPDVGTSWTKLWADATATLQANTSDYCAASGNDANVGLLYTADATYPSANYSIQFTLTAVSGTAARTLYVLARIQDQENMYGVYIKPGTTAAQLYKKVSGTWSALGSAFTLPAAGSVCRLEVKGSLIEFFDDGVSVASAIDSAISAAGKGGIAEGGGAELIASTDDVSLQWQVDNFSITEIVIGDSIPYLLRANRRRFQPLLVR